MPITFHNADIKFSLARKAELKTFITKRVFTEVKKKANLSFIFCSDEYLLDINRQFLNHDYYTDILTFPLSETEKLIEAEIYISIDRVKENAAKLRLPFDNELNRVIFHGALHLLEHKDKTKAQKAEMRQKEEEWLRAFEKDIRGKNQESRKS